MRPERADWGLIRPRGMTTEREVAKQRMAIRLKRNLSEKERGAAIISG